MKIPKEIKRFCPYCKKHTIHKVKQEKNRGKNKAHPLTRESKIRLKLRGVITGFGNKGKISRGAMNKWKRYNKKHTKKTDLRYTCTECKKTSVPNKKGIRTKKLVLE